MEKEIVHDQGTPEVVWSTENIFIDWITLSAENDGRWPIVNNGYSVHYDQREQPENTTERFLQVEGSYSSKATVRCTHELLEISFNPSRYHKPENLFGVTYEQAIQVTNAMLEEIGLQPLQEFTVTRFDVTLNIETGSKRNLQEYLRQGRKIKLPRMKTIGRWNNPEYKNSRKRIKIYDKADELEDNALKDAKRWKHRYKITEVQEEEHHLERCRAYCEKRGIARVELQLGRHWLDDNNLRESKDINHEKLVEHFMKQTEGIIKSVEEFEEADLEWPYIGTYYLWKSGENPAEHMSKNTYYKHRNHIRDATGIDIAIHPAEDLENQRKRRKFSTQAAEVPGFYRVKNGMAW